ncbi:MAG: divalent metal cation transporter, partial [Candidatus Eremiobacteraeota bacterium]|nr:divalent metal cation transporter [Candidatus Eremiobacteraeota bacterium]
MIKVQAEGEIRNAVPESGATQGREEHEAPRPFWRVLGPGLITGASDDDPSGISTYSVAGATAGLSVLWLALLTTPMMAAIQGMCARIGMVTGLGLAANMRKHMPLFLVYPLALLVIVANTFNVGADLEGMAASARMVLGLPEPLWVILFALVIVFGQFAFSYGKIAAVLKYLALSLLAYIVTAFVVRPHWPHVLLSAIVPHVELNASWLLT